MDNEPAHIKRVTADDMAHALRCYPLHKWQVDWIAENSRNMIANCGRKTGKTLATSIKLALALLYQKMPSVGLSGGICVISKGARQSKEIMASIKVCVSLDGWTFTRSRDAMNAEEKIAYASTTELMLPFDGYNNRILCLPAGLVGDNLRPYSFMILYFDEDDFLGEDIHISTSACLARFEGQEILASTWNPDSDKDSYFGKAWINIDYKKFTIWSRDCPKSCPPAWLAKQRGKMDLADYQREFECKRTEAATGIFSHELLAACVTKVPLNHGDLWKLPTFLGVDVARFGRDDNVICMAHWNGQKAFIRIEVMHGKMRTTVIEAAIKGMLAQHPSIRKVVMDSGGVGGGPTDALVQAVGSWKVVEITNQTRTDDVEGRRKKYIKVDLYSNLARMCEHGMIVFDYDKRIISSLRSIRWRYGANNVLSVYSMNNNDHIAEAVVRAVFLLRNMRVRSIASGSHSPDIIVVPHDQASLNESVLKEMLWSTDLSSK